MVYALPYFSSKTHKLGFQARLHLPKGKLPPYIKKALNDNSSVDLCEWLEIPFGMEVEQAITLTAEQVKNLPFDNRLFQRIVIPVGSGMTLAGIIEGLKFMHLNS